MRKRKHSGKAAKDHDQVAAQRFALVARVMTDAVWDWDLINDAVWWNDGFTTLFGYAPEDIGTGPESWYGRIHPDDAKRVTDGIHEVIDAGGQSWSDEYRFRRADDSYADIFDRGFVIRNDDGKPIRMVGAMVDVTARNRAAERQRALYDIAQAANTVADLPALMAQIHEIVGTLLPAGNLYIAMYDPVKDVLSFPYWADERSESEPARAFGRGLTEYVIRTGEAQLITPLTYRDLHERGEATMIGEPAAYWLGVPLTAHEWTFGVLAVQTYSHVEQYGEAEKDILQFVSTQIAMAIDRKRVESQLRGSERRYRRIFEANPEAMFVYDRETLRFLDVNQAAIRRYGFGRDEFLAMTIRELRPPSEIARLEAALATAQGPQRYENVTHQRKDGSPLEVEVLSDDIIFEKRHARLVIARDVSDRRRLEQQVIQSQKMEAVGRLAGGVAHDFNNLLTVITSYSELLMNAFAAEDPRRQDVAEIRDAATRAASLTQQLLAFSRKQMLRPQVLDLNEVVGRTEKLLRRLIGEHIRLETTLEGALGAIRADPTQLEQVIVNLAVNARDAMPEGGRLLIETANAEPEVKHTAEHSLVTPGPYVRLTVTDTGVGMDEATRSRLFEPFFTTKEVGKGTGLGLSTVYGIIKQSGGFIWAESSPGEGTCFKMYFPRADANVIDPIPDPAVVGDTGRETVLLVEDEPALRAAARRSLEMRGYNVLEADNADAALRIADQHAGRVDLMLTDVVMPGLSGRELAMRLAESKPDVRVLFMSGYTDDAIVQHGVLEPGVAFLQKPFSPDTLARKVRELLDKPVRRATTVL